MSINFAVKWSDNTDELRRNLAAGVAQLDITQARVDKLVTSLSGDAQIRSANNWAAALQKLGGEAGALAGVEKLTTAETDRATAAIDRAIGKYTALGQQAPRALQDISDALHKASDETTGWTQILGNMGNSWVARVAEGMLLRDAIHAVLGEIKSLATALPEIALKGAGVADVEENFTHLAAGAGRLGATLVGELRSGTHGTISDFELMKTASKDLTAGMGLTDKQFGVLAKGAFALAQATGTDVKGALDTMNDAMLTGRTRALALLTGKIDATKAEEDYAKSLGTTADHLSAEGKIEASREAILKAVGAATERLGEQTDGLDERVAQAGVAWDNFRDNLGKTIATSAVLDAGLSGLQSAITDALGPAQGALIDAIARKVDDAAIAAISLGKVGVESGAALAKEWYAAKVVFGDVAQVVDGVRLSILLTQQAAALGILPGTADLQKWKALDETIGRLELTMKLRGDSLQADKAAQGSIDSATQGYLKTLDALQVKMEAARSTAASFVGPLEDGASAQQRAADAAARHAAMLQASKEEIAAAKKAQEEYAKAIERYNSTDGADYESILNKIGNTMYEGIAFDKARGKSTEDLIKIYKTTSTVIEQVVKSEENFAAAVKATEKNIESSEAAGLEAAAAVSKAFAGPQLILKNLLISTGAVPISLHSILAPTQQIGQLMTDVTVTAKEHFDDLSDAITGDFTDIVTTMRSHGVQTRADLQLTANQFKSEYQAMLASGKFTTDQLQAAWQRYRVAVAAVHPELAMAYEDEARFAAGVGAINSALAPIANLSPAFTLLHSTINGVTTGIEGAAKASADMATHGMNAQNVAQLSASWVGLAISVYQAIDAFVAAKDAEIDAANALEWAHGLALAFDSATLFSEQLTDSITKQGLEIQKALNALDKYKNGGSGDLGRGYAEALHLPDIIDELGGFDKAFASTPEIISKIGILFDAFKEGGALATEATKSLDTVLSGMGAAAAENGGIVNQAFLDMEKHAKELGMDIKDTEDFMQGQASNAEAGIGSALTIGNDAYAKRKDLLQQISDATDQLKTQTGSAASDTKSKIDDLNAQLATQQQIIDATAIHSQAAADAVTGSLVGIIGSQVQAGKSFHDSVVAIGPSVDALSQQMIDAGFHGGAAFDFLRGQVALVNDSVAGPALTAVEGYAAGLVGLNNAGLLNEDMFAGLTGQIGQTRDALVAQGKDGNQVMAAMKGPLQTMWELEQKFGYTTDDSTQALIDQAVQQGIVGDKFKSVADQQLDATNRIADAIEGLAEVFGVLPKAAKDAATGISDELGKIKAPSITIPIRTTGDGYDFKSPMQGGPNSDPNAQSLASRGGYVGATRVMHLAAGGPVGTDTVPAWLTPGESVLTKAATAALGLGTIAAWNSGNETTTGVVPGNDFGITFEQIAAAQAAWNAAQNGGGRVGITDPGQGPNVDGQSTGGGWIGPGPWTPPNVWTDASSGGASSDFDAIASSISSITNGAIGASQWAPASDGPGNAGQAQLVAKLADLVQSSVQAQSAAGASGDGNLHITLQLDGVTVAKTVVQQFRKTPSVGNAAKANLGLSVTRWT